MKLKLVKKVLEAKDTKSFYWEAEKKVDYLPGQFYYFTLPKLKYPDTRGSTRHFTLSSSPTEGQLLRFTTRMRQVSGYKETLDKLKIGAIIDGEGPSGTFIMDEKEKGGHVLIAGGIGITPFRSFIKYNIDQNISAAMHLIYANSTPQLITFKEELEAWAKNHKNIRVDMTISKPLESKETWDGLTGRIDESLLRKLLADNLKTTYWICGPPLMVTAMENVLKSLKIASNKIRFEKFTGY